MIFTRPMTIGLVFAVAATAALAASHNAGPAENAVKARKAHMDLSAHNIGILGAMAKGEMEFDAAMAQGAADNLAALSSMNQMSYWLPGSSADDIEGTRALAKLWENIPDAMEKGQALATAAAALAANAGTLDGVRANIGAVGGACGACHKAYRAPDK